MPLSTDDFLAALSSRQSAAEARDHTVPGRRHIRSGEEAVAELRRAGAEGDLDDMLAFEQAAITFDLSRRVNSAAMRKSLEKAAGDLAITRRLVEMVADPERYAMIDAGHARKENRAGDLPRDEARQFFKSHFARLLNQDKTGLDDVEKRMIDIRRANISRAETLYTARQRTALGLPEPAPRRGRAR